MRRRGHVEVKDDQLAGCALGRAGWSAPHQMLTLQVVVCDGGRMQDVNEAFGLEGSVVVVVVVVIVVVGFSYAPPSPPSPPGELVPFFQHESSHCRRRGSLERPERPYMQ